MGTLKRLFGKSSSRAADTSSSAPAISSANGPASAAPATPTATAFNLTDEEKALFHVMFAPRFYAGQAGLPETASSDELYTHFLTTGLASGMSPTPLFEPDVYHEHEGHIDPELADQPALVRWCRTRYKTGVIPTTRFDVDFYLDTYEELRAPEVDPFEHFLRHGLQEGRRPNAAFDPVFYEQVAPEQHREQEPRLYIHYLTLGIPAGAAPSAVLAPFMTRTPADRALGLHGYDAVARALSYWYSAVGLESAELLVSLCHPYLYDGRGAVASSVSGTDRLLHFLNNGVDQGLDPGPFFDVAYYKRKAGLGSGIAKTESTNAVLHYLASLVEERIVPNEFFDEALYRESWADLQDGTIWPFGHFLTAGIFEGRRIDGKARENEYTSPLDSTAGQVRNWQLYWTDIGLPEPRRGSDEDRSDPVVAQSISMRNFTNLSDRDFEFLKALFVPAWYSQQLGKGLDLSADELFAHYLSHGMDKNLSPSPLFDPAMAVRLLNIRASESAMRNWLPRRGSIAEAPTRFLDLEFYRKLYPEFKGVKMDLYEHFVLHGLFEGRTPNPIFDPFWYGAAYAERVEAVELPPFIHFLTAGADDGLCPSRAMLPVYGMNDTGSAPTLADFTRIVAAFRKISKRLSAQRCFALIAFFTPHIYEGGDDVAAGGTAGIRRFMHFIETGLWDGLTPGPLFDTEYYARARSGRRIFEIRSEAPFLHYLNHGWPKQFVPNTIFDDSDYLSRYGDIKASGTWGFQHFLFHGIFEGRQSNAVRNFTVVPRKTDVARTELERWVLFWSGLGEVPPSFRMNPGLALQQRRIVDLVQSDVYDEIVRRAQAIDPSLGEPRTISAVYAAPFHDRAADAMAAILERIPQKIYGTIVTVPWLRTGGADLVACQVASAVIEARPGENVLLLRVDQKHLERPDWLPEGVDQVLIADLLDELSGDQAESLLYSLILSLQPERIINVNSLKMWRTFERFGNRLSTKVNLYSYLFCWDQTAQGLRVGYPSMFYAATSPYLAATFTDTDYLRDELVKMYRPPLAVAKATVPLYTPVRSEPTDKTMAELSVSRPARNARPVVLWAGRLDRQKRFDLVGDIARLMPDVDFMCWGDALLDSPPDLHRSPRNLKLNPGFKNYSDLPLETADAWLFTSAWEGMPTILLELAIRGVAVIASQVGGVPEMADDETSFPVDDIDNPDAYVEAIRFALNNPQVRVERARTMQERAAQRHSTKAYVAKIKEVFDLETAKD
jgi:glycosyltransferase involved in cell wall biosynthesis